MRKCLKVKATWVSKLALGLLIVVSPSITHAGLTQYKINPIIPSGNAGDPVYNQEIADGFCSSGVWTVSKDPVFQDYYNGFRRYSSTYKTGGTMSTPFQGFVWLANNYGAGTYILSASNASATYCPNHNDSYGTNSYAIVIVSASGTVNYIDPPTPATTTPTQTSIKNINNPLSGSLQSSTTVNFNFDYYFNSSDLGKYISVGGEIFNTQTGTTSELQKYLIGASGTSTYSYTKYLASSTLYMWRPIIYGATSTNNINGQYSTFDVVTYTGQFDVYTEPSSTTTLANLTLECTDDLVSGSLCKVFGYLFVPSPNILSDFSNLWKNIQTKRPFGYVTKTIDELSGLTATGSPAFTLGTVPFMDSLFTPFRTAIAGILWGLFAVFFYRRRLTTLEI